jgi:hypothetical protein
MHGCATLLCTSHVMVVNDGAEMLYVDLYA